MRKVFSLKDFVIASFAWFYKKIRTKILVQV